MKRKGDRLRPWELALLLVLCLALCASVWAEGEEEKIDSSLIRLHVLAASDEAGEQAIKLRVRDAVLAYLEPLLAGAESKSEAGERLSRSLPGLQSAASAAAEGRKVTVTLTRERYPTRLYGDFALPAGEYDSLRVILGAGEGRNWWCVVFPPLCLAAESGESMEEALGTETFQLLSADGRTAFRFKLLELWGELRSGF